MKIVVAVGGASCSGKSTLTNWLAEIFRGQVVHQDKFYKKDSDIPLINGMANWDCPEAIDTDSFVKALQKVKLDTGDKNCSALLGANRPSLNTSDISANALSRLNAEVKETSSLFNAKLSKPLELVFVDGFLLYNDPRVFNLFDMSLFLEATIEVLASRRAAREHYITEEGTWKDPPNYFEQVVWPEYLKNNQNILDRNSTLPSSPARQWPNLINNLVILDTKNVTIEQNVSKAVLEMRNSKPSNNIQATVDLYVRVAITCIVFTCVVLYATMSFNTRESLRVDEVIIRPPIAEKRPSITLRLHNVTLEDEYAWLRNISTDPSVSKYIHDETAYAKQYLSTLEDLQKDLLKEILALNEKADSSRDQECVLGDKDMTSFWEYGSYLYWITYRHNETYPIYMRHPLQCSAAIDNETPPSECLCQPQTIDSTVTVIDFNDYIQQNVSYYSIGVFEISPVDPNMLVYSVDFTGSEKFKLFVWNITSQSHIIIPSIEDAYYSVRWGISALLNMYMDTAEAQQATQWIYYNVVHPIHAVPMSIHRICVVNCLEMGKIDIIYEESDISLTVEMASTTDNMYLMLKVVGQITSESHICYHVSANGKQDWSLQLIAKRQEGILYDVDHENGYFYIRSNWDNQFNFQILKMPVDHSLPLSFPILHSNKVDVVLPHSESRFLERIEGLKDHLVVWIREHGLRSVMIINLISFSMRTIRVYNDDPKTQVFSVFPGTLSAMEDRLFRRHDASYVLVSKSSFLHPISVYAIDFKTLALETIYEYSSTDVDTSEYEQELLWVSSAGDYQNTNVRVPISIVRKRPSHLDKSVSSAHSALIISYGAYGGYQEAAFVPEYFPLINRGVLIAICHPRGDGDLGSQWYMDGKYEKKANTMIDTRACVEGLVEMGYVERGRIALKARSAGGLIAGDSIFWKENEEPLVDVVVAEVPFIDPIFDLIDESVPWTAFEWFEWGNPKDKVIFDAMLGYSPYYNVQYSSQPAVFITAGILDTRVPFYEPVKFVAKLRAKKTNEININNDAAKLSDSASKNSKKKSRGTPLILRVYDAGHFSSSSEISKIHQMVEWYAFVLSNLGIS